MAYHGLAHGIQPHGFIEKGSYILLYLVGNRRLYQGDGSLG